MSDDNVIKIYFEDYRYGMMLAEHGIGFAELREDWPEVLLSEYAMRGYRDVWTKRGYAEPWMTTDPVFDPVIDPDEPIPF